MSLHKEEAQGMPIAIDLKHWSKR